MAGQPIDIGDIEVGDRIRVVNSVDDMTFTVTKISTPSADGFGFRAIYGDTTKRVFGGRPGVQSHNQFFLVERPRPKEARALAELAATKTQIPHDIIRRKLAPMLGLTEKAGKGRRKTRRRKTRKSRK